MRPTRTATLDARITICSSVGETLIELRFLFSNHILFPRQASKAETAAVSLRALTSLARIQRRLREPEILRPVTFPR